MTSILKIPELGAAEAARRAREVLDAGGVVAFPTETVYGLAVRGDDPAALERLYRLKGRDRDKPLARYVDSAAAVGEIETAVSLRAEKLMRAFWPGPLTLVLDDGSARRGYRCSSHPVASLMAAGTGRVILGSSANLSGEPPIEDAAELPERLGPELELILDEGRNLAGLASTVVDLPRAGGFRVLRPGEIGIDLLRAELRSLLVIVCSGNTCRSPLAAALLARALAERDLGDAEACELEIRSAGLSALPGLPASPHSRTIASGRGLDLERHASRLLDPRTLERADRIYTMTAAHREAILAERPDLEDRVLPIAGPGHDIVDPYGGDLAVYEACARELDLAVKAVLEQL